MGAGALFQEGEGNEKPHGSTYEMDELPDGFLVRP